MNTAVRLGGVFLCFWEVCSIREWLGLGLMPWAELPISWVAAGSLGGVRMHHFPLRDGAWVGDGRW